MLREFMDRFFTIFLPMVLAVGALVVFRIFGMDHPVVRPIIDQIYAVMWNTPVGASDQGEPGETAASELVAPAELHEMVATHFRLTPRESYRYSVPQIARGQSRAHDLVIGDESLRFYSYHPRGTEPVPLVILFHGVQRDGLSMIDMWRRTAMREGFALLAPDSPGRSWDVAAPAPDVLEAMLAQLATLYPLDTQRVYLFGHSAGAAYVKVLINGHAGPWRAAAVHAGAVTGLPGQGLGKPVRVYMGDGDATLSLEDARQSAEALARNGSETTLVIIPGHNHWFYDIGPQIADDAWAWFSGPGSRQVAAR